jgi:Glycine-rich domain
MTEHTYHTNIALPAVGGDIDLWGEILNEQTFGKLDLILGQFVTIAVSGADILLTDDQWQNMGIWLTGALTANINLIVPLIPTLTMARGGMRLVLNSTTGTGTVTFKTAATGSIGVLVPRDSLSLVVSDTIHGRILASAGNQGGANPTGYPPLDRLNITFGPGTTNWTVPVGVTRVYVECWGGGGGGGGTAAVGIRYAATPGGGGGYTAGWKDVTPGASVTVTVGAGGIGSNGSGPGGNGGTTTFGSAAPMSATGGSGGQSASSSPTSQVGGGTASGGTLNFAGNGGSGSQKSDSAGWYCGPGGHSPRGGGGGFSASTGGAPGGNPGGGAGAGGSSDGPDATGQGGPGTGGNGGAGLCLVSY